MDKFLFGAAYYDEYMPTDRISTDIEMMKKIGFNTVRIAESTWSTLEPQPGVFDFTHIDRALDAFEEAGINIIVGTPTYAVPAWLVAAHPSVLATTHAGPGRYGARQIMNITDPAYLFHAERVIRKLMERTAHRPGVIGFQIDNETKYHDVASPDVQRMFVKYLRNQFKDDLSALNMAFGLDYWSNRVDAWEDFPDVRGTINGSLAAEFDKFRRGLVDQFLSWQSSLVREYSRPDQFVTQNFDFDWAPGWSYGLQPSVNHFTAASAVDVAGVDIYHPTQDHLTGKEIAFGGDMTRSIKGGANYLVLETQAQGQVGWLPYPGQLRLQAFSHLASGADGVMYWHWHSIHNSFETYWKGVLSHDLAANPTYEEAGVIGREIESLRESLVHLRKNNRTAIMVSNEALTALKWFTLDTGFPDNQQSPGTSYNDVLRWVYDALFDLNVEVDFVSTEDDDLGRYDLLLVPALYTADHSVSERLAAFTHDGGTLVTTFRTAVADEYTKVWHDRAPHGLTDVLGCTYNQFTIPENVQLETHHDLKDAPGMDPARTFMELLTATSAETLVSYDHPAWGGYSAVTRNRFGAGTAFHIGTMTSPATLQHILRVAVQEAGVEDWAQKLAGSITVRRGTNQSGQSVTYLLNYSSETVEIRSPHPARNIITDSELTAGGNLGIGPWDLAVLVAK
ncbi:beta-galactosidase [Paenarthrobacter sp. NPDC089989]|uniref:beta-galactosidase n=1 Tax=unclassified Paenarthrobacter TaxID=2634190 RepID=UPI00381B7292